MGKKQDSLQKLKRKKHTTAINSELPVKAEGNLNVAYEEKNMKKKKKDNKKKGISCEISDKVNEEIFEQSIIKDEAPETSERKKKSKKSRSTKKKNGEISADGIGESDIPQTEKIEYIFSGEEDATNEPDEQLTKSKKKKKRKSISRGNKIDEFNKEEDVAEQQNDEGMADAAHSKTENLILPSEEVDEPDMRSSKPGKSKKASRTKTKSQKKSQLLEDESPPENLIQKRGEDAEDEIYEMSSGDEDSSRGMKKWIMQYHQSRPGLMVLQEKIDDFIMAHEAREEVARKQREAEAAEGGWTVVVHHKGRKKTTDAEGGIAVGSVAQAAVLDKMAKKKNREVGLDFYRFQKREAHRNEVMMLQSKFEQDKMRIQQMRAARKFRPY